MTLGEARIQRFLATKDIAILATVKVDGAPLAMPMWFLHDAASLTMISVEGTHKVRNLRRDARVCVVAEAGSGGGDERGVTVLGKAEFKYPRLERLWTGRAMPPNRVMFRIVPAHVRCWGLE